MRENFQTGVAGKATQTGNSDADVNVDDGDKNNDGQDDDDVDDGDKNNDGQDDGNDDDGTEDGATFPIKTTAFL